MKTLNKICAYGATEPLAYERIDNTSNFTYSNYGVTLDVNLTSEEITTDICVIENWLNYQSKVIFRTNNPKEFFEWLNNVIPELEQQIFANRTHVS